MYIPKTSQTSLVCVSTETQPAFFVINDKISVHVVRV